MKAQSIRLAVLLALAFAAPLLVLAADVTVYVTKTGKKYHNAGCSSLRLSAIPMKLSEAAQRYGPCGNCKPPVPGAAAATPTNTLAPTRTPNATPAPQPRSQQCAATTQKHTRCKRMAKPGSSYCWQHGG